MEAVWGFPCNRTSATTAGPTRDVTKRKFAASVIGEAAVVFTRSYAKGRRVQGRSVQWRRDYIQIFFIFYTSFKGTSLLYMKIVNDINRYKYMI